MKRPPRHADDDDNDGNAEGPRSKLPLLISGFFFIVVIIAGVIYWLMTKNEVLY